MTTTDVIGTMTPVQKMTELVADLQTKRQELRKTALEERSTKADLDRAIERIAQDECLHICQMMHLKLPAELREIVYRYVCIEDQPIPVGPYFHFKQYEYSPLVKERLRLEACPDILDPNDARINAPASNERDNYITLPDGRLKYDHSKKVLEDIVMPDYHLFDGDYAGAAIASEAQTFYYKNNTFSLCNLDQGIVRFLERGRSVGIRHDKIYSQQAHDGAGKIKPIDLVRNLQIRIKFEHYAPFLDAFMEPATGSEQIAYHRNFLRKSRAELETLLNIPGHDRTLNIEFIIMTALDYDDEDSWCIFTNMLQTVRNDIYRLMYDRDDILIKVIHHDDGLTPFPRNITRLWSLTKEQWQHEKRENVRPIRPLTGDWTADFYVGEFVRERMRVLGIPRLQLPDMLRERWGIQELFRDTEPRWPIEEGRFWPVYHHAAMGTRPVI